MEIRHAKENDLSRIMEIYAYAREFMKKTGNPNQWGVNNWPPVSMIEDDIQQKKCYVCTENENIIGVFYYDYGMKIESSYNEIEGEWIGGDEYGVIHRMASDGSQKGIGAFCINYAIEKCGHIRIDTHGDNIPMQNLLKKMGFTRCGIIYVPQDDDPRLAYEKMTGNSN